MKAKKSYKKGGKFPDLTGDGKVTRADVLKGRGVFKEGGKMKMYKKGGMAGLSAAQKEVYRRGLAAYMSSGNRPKVSQHAWAMARVKRRRSELAKARKNNAYICIHITNNNGYNHCNTYTFER
jgi:hypothetical protein